MADKIGIALRIVQHFLTEGEDFSIREIARHLNISPTLTHYYMKRLANLGVLVRLKIKDNESYGYYLLQDLFTEDPEETLKLLHSLREKVDDGSDETLGECLRFFLKCTTFL